MCGTNTDISNLSYEFKYWGLHKFTINSLATFKFWVPEGWHVNSSILRTHNSGVTRVSRSYLELSARCTRTDIFCMQAEKAEIIRLEIVGFTLKISDQAPATFLHPCSKYLRFVLYFEYIGYVLDKYIILKCLTLESPRERICRTNSTGVAN